MKTRCCRSDQNANFAQNAYLADILKEINTISLAAFVFQAVTAESGKIDLISVGLGLIFCAACVILGIILVRNTAYAHWGVNSIHPGFRAGDIDSNLVCNHYLAREK